MHSPVSRKTLSKTRTLDLDLHLPAGEWVVCWHSSYLYTRDSTVPLVNTIFRRLRGEHLGEFETRPIAVSRLGLYQPGQILSGNTLVGYVDTETEEFEVNYSDWKFINRQHHRSNGRALPFTDAEYELPPECDGDWLINLPIADGSLLINCTEFLVRAYSRRSEIPRILTTYSWPGVKQRFFSYQKKHDTDWVIYPHASMVDEDMYFLAHAKYDLHTIKACRTIHSQLDNEAFKNGVPFHLQVMPWFLGPGKLRCRGYRINNDQDFLCTELIGMSLPEGSPFEFIRLKSDKDDQSEDNRRIPQNQHKLQQSDNNLVPMTDNAQPRRGAQKEDVDLGEFAVIYPSRPVRRTKEITNTSKAKVVLTDAPQAEQFTTSENHGNGDELTGRLFLSYRDVPASAGGKLIDMWNAFQHLQKSGHIDSVCWYVPEDTYGNSLPLTCIEIANPTHSWINLGGGRTRGMLALRIRAKNQTFLVLELERALTPTKDDSALLKEDTISGMICKISSRQQACDIIHTVSQGIAEKRGNFKAIAGLPDFRTFRHRNSDKNNVPLESAAINALLLMGLDIPRARKAKQQKAET